MNKKFYITTTIPYANAPPHIGFALEIVQADVLARWHKMKGEEVFFLTGTDEHGTKNYQTAKNQGLDTKDFVDKNSNFFKELTKVLNISNNKFIKTTDKNIHWPGVINMWKILTKKGDIYKKKYTGAYCSGCERFITEKELENGHCPNHPNLEIQNIAEENYFFNLSKYSNKITKLVKEDKIKIRPLKWKNDFLSLIKGGLTDVSFSREKKHLPWGIPVSGDEDQVMYVWCDALVNYLTGIGYPNKNYKKWWPADVHVVGKDMLRFHTGIWPGMLLSAGLPLPKEVIVHGFLTVDGRKMSKSLGNVIAPLDLAKKYPADSIRYILMRAVPFGDDGDFSEQTLIERHNNELANKLGNLVSRVSALAEKHSIQRAPNKLLKKLKLKQIEKHIDNYELDKALNEVFAFIDICNEYIQSKKPWEAKTKSEIANAKKVLYELSDSIKAIAILLWPFIPSTSEKIARNFNFKIEQKQIAKQINKPLTVSKIKKADILFQKIEIKPKTEEKTNKNQKENNLNNKTHNKIEGVMTMSEVNYQDWEKIELRVGKIINVEDIEGADKLYKLTVDVGSEVGKRTICAGIKQHYKKDELKNKKIILFVNLAPRMMRGIESQGMLLAAVNNDESKVILISPEKDIEIGSRVR